MGAVVATVDGHGLRRAAELHHKLNRLRVAGGVTVGLTPQVRLTLPLDPPTDANERLNVAFCPEKMVCEVDDPGAGAIVKSIPVPETITTYDPVPALSATIRFALNSPPAVGANVTLIVQLVSGSTVVQLFV